MSVPSANSGERGGWRRLHPALEIGALGLLSGCLTVAAFMVVEPPRTEWPIPGTDLALAFDAFSVIPGIVFGVIIGVALLWRGLANAGQVAAYVLAAGVSNFAATNLALNIFEAVDNSLVIGMIAGLFGAACLTALSIAILPFCRRWPPCLLMVVAGCLLGGLLAVPLDRIDGEPIVMWMVLYAPWQAGFAAAFGTAVPPHLPAAP